MALTLVIVVALILVVAGLYPEPLFALSQTATEWLPERVR
jgi:hypothetical protein